jgi:hypothetical protein
MIINKLMNILKINENLKILKDFINNYIYIKWNKHNSRSGYKIIE